MATKAGFHSGYSSAPSTSTAYFIFVRQYDAIDPTILRDPTVSVSATCQYNLISHHFENSFTSNYHISYPSPEFTSLYHISYPSVSFTSQYSILVGIGFVTIIDMGLTTFVVFRTRVESAPSIGSIFEVI